MSLASFPALTPDSYGISFQRNGVINDHSLDVWGIGPGLKENAITFSVCTWLMTFYVVSVIARP
jgi:hypothetical protein